MTSFLEGGLALVEEEPATIAWFAIRLGPSEFGIFDAFLDDAGRQAHLGGQVAAALMAQAPEPGAAAGDRASRRSRGQAARLTAAGFLHLVDVVGDQSVGFAMHAHRCLGVRAPTRQNTCRLARPPVYTRRARRSAPAPCAAA